MPTLFYVQMLYDKKAPKGQQSDLKDVVELVNTTSPEHKRWGVGGRVKTNMP